jgi:hypothetical protein
MALRACLQKVCACRLQLSGIVRRDLFLMRHCAIILAGLGVATTIPFDPTGTLREINMAITQEIKEALQSITLDYWTAHNRALLLSNLPPLMEARVTNYKELLEKRSLKSVIKEIAAEAEVRLVVHPTHPAKVAVVPATVEFEFQEDARPAPAKSSGTSQTQEDEPVLLLLRALARLAPEELDKVSIPVSVFVKLLK